MSGFRALLTHDLLKRSLLFSLSVVASTLVGVISIPLISASVGIETWGRLYILQVLGQFASILIAFGWGATGPSQVSPLPASEQRQFLFESLFVRVPLFFAVGPIAVGIAVLMQAEPLTAVLAVITYAFPGIGAAWYFIGTKRPVAMLLLEALPAIIAQIAGLVAVSVWGTLQAYLWATAVITTLGIVSGLVWSLAGRGSLRVPEFRQVRSTVSRQFAGFATVVFSNLSITLPALIVEFFARPLVPAFGIFDRFYRYAIIVLAPILQAVQGWVPEDGGRHMRQRSLQSLWIGIAVGVVGGGALALLAPWASAKLTAGELSLPFSITIMAGLGFAAECISQIVGLAGLVALGRSGALARSSVIAAVVGIPLLVPAVLLWGIHGVVAVVALSALFVAVFRVLVLFQALRMVKPDEYGTQVSVTADL